MSSGTENATLIVSKPIVGSDTHDRAILELDEGGWLVGRVPRADRSKFEREFLVTIEQLKEAAIFGLEGNPVISGSFNKQAGKALAAGVLILMLGIGLIKPEGKAE